MSARYASRATARHARRRACSSTLSGSEEQFAAAGILFTLTFAAPVLVSPICDEYSDAVLFDGKHGIDAVRAIVFVPAFTGLVFAICVAITQAVLVLAVGWLLYRRRTRTPRASRHNGHQPSGLDTTSRTHRRMQMSFAYYAMLAASCLHVLLFAVAAIAIWSGADSVAWIIMAATLLGGPAATGASVSLLLMRAMLRGLLEKDGSWACPNLAACE